MAQYRMEGDVSEESGTVALTRTLVAAQDGGSSGGPADGED
jgi:hypothetical protein